MSRKSSAPQRILVIRFRQIGDAVLATSVCTTLRRTFPGARIDMVLNSGIAPLFEGHPDIDRVIRFAPGDNKPLGAYLRKIWKTVREGRYDMIVDQRSTVRTLLFSLMSLRTPWRLGRKKWYTRPLLNAATDNASPVDLTMVERDLLLLRPLERHFDVKYSKDFTLDITDDERLRFREKMREGDIDMARKVMLVGVSAKLPWKRWRMDYMVETLRRVIAHRPDVQMIFNYAPGDEEAEAREVYRRLGEPECVKIGIEARGIREMAVMAACCDFYFGNEGGARHIVQAVGVPSFAIFSPSGEMQTWLPKTSTPASGISYLQKISPDEIPGKSYGELMDSVTPDDVYPPLEEMMDRYVERDRESSMAVTS